MSAVLKFHAKPKYTGFETRQYVLRHENALHLKLARLLKDLGERIAQATETVSIGALTKVEWHEEDHPRDEDGKFVESVSDGLGYVKDVGSQIAYHHTSESAASKIEAEGFNESGNSMYGKGVYLTDKEAGYNQYGNTRLDIELAPHRQLSVADDTDVPRVLRQLTGVDPMFGDVSTKLSERGIKSLTTTVDGERYTVVFDKSIIKIRDRIKKVSLAALTKAAKPTTPPWLRRLLAKVKLDEFAVKLADAIEPESEAAYKAAGLFANQVLSTQNAPVSRFDLIDERAVAFAAKRAAWLVGSGTNPAYAITDAVREDVRRIVTQATKEGWASQTLAREIRDAEAFSDARAKNIARTELAFAHEQGALDEWRASGVVVGKRSILADTHPHPDVCDAAADEGVIPLDAMFVSGVDAPPHHPSACFAGHTFSPFGSVIQMVRASYDGPAISLTLAPNEMRNSAPGNAADSTGLADAHSGIDELSEGKDLHIADNGGMPRLVIPDSKRLTIGPEHPVLTRRGFVLAKFLMEGDEVLYQDTSELSSTTSAGLDLENVPMIEDFFNSCLAVFGRSSIPGAHLYFHGDEIFIHGEIDVIRPTGDLLPVFNPVGIEKLCKCDLSGAYTDSFHVAGCGSCLKLFERAFSSPGCLVSLPSDFETPFRGEASPPDTHLLGLNLDGCDTRGPGLFSPLLKRKSAHLGFSTFRVCAVHETHFKGMAFDASTQRQLYAVNGLVVKNCLCALVPEVEVPVAKTADWDESKHPRAPAGTSTGGQWTSSSGEASTGQVILDKEMENNSPDNYKKKVAKDLTESLLDHPLFQDSEVADVRNYVQRNLDLWAETSGDHNPGAVAIQLAAEAEFGLKGVSGHYDDEILTKARKIFETSGDKDRAFLRTMYDNTQRYLKENRIAELYVARGVVDVEPFKPQAVVGDIQSSVVNTHLAAMSSYSTDSGKAQFFGSTEGLNGRMYLAKVPAASVLSTPFTGIGCLGEKEVVVLGGKHRQVALAKNVGGDQSAPSHIDLLNAFGGNLARPSDIIAKAMKGATSALKKVKKALWMSEDLEPAFDDYPDKSLKNADWPKRTDDSLAAHGVVAKTRLSLLRKADWDESKHPRDERGRFWYHGSSDKHISTDETHLRPGLDGVVWLTTMYDKAVRFANQTAERHGGTPIIYVVEDKDAPQDPTNFGSEDIRSVNKPVRIYSRGEALHKTVEPTPSVKKTRLSLLRKEGQK